ncbi:MAG: hypothetical protein V2A58_14375, partial [Planctomycetota bacterium]
AQGHVTVYGLKGTAFAAGYGGELVLTTSAGEERLRREAENCNYLMCDDFIRLIHGGRSRLSTHDAVAATAVTLAIKRSILKR